MRLKVPTQSIQLSSRILLNALFGRRDRTTRIQGNPTKGFFAQRLKFLEFPAPGYIMCAKCYCRTERQMYYKIVIRLLLSSQHVKKLSFGI